MPGLQLTSEANSQDLTSQIDFLCDSDSTSYPLADKVRNLNASVEELVADIIEADGEWQFDDTNHTDLPVGTINLTNGQSNYSFNEEFLSVEQILIKNSSGQWKPLKPIDPREFKEFPVEEFFQDTGLSTHYDIIGDTIFLYPAPSTNAVTLATGLKVRFKRTIDLFTTTDTTQQAGIPSTHHSMLAYMASIPYCMKYKKDRVVPYQRKVDSMKPTLMEIYARRQKDVAPAFSTKPILNRVK